MMMMIMMVMIIEYPDTTNEGGNYIRQHCKNEDNHYKQQDTHNEDNCKQNERKGINVKN